MPDSSQVKEITAKLEQGVKDLFNSETYADYLKTMSRFHKYSTRNTLLIHLQYPNATLVAGYQSWQNKFERNVVKGAKAIKILAPVPFTKREEKEIFDPETNQPIIGEDGTPVVEVTERHIARFKVTNVFDVSQTEGKPLPTLVQDLTGNVEQYEAFMDALHAVSPLPIVFEQMEEGKDGYCRFGEKIAIREGMSEIQTVCAIIHEMTHSKLHDIEALRLMDENAKPKDRRTEEVEAESVSYAVNQFFGIETGANSIGYVAEWSRGRELRELNASLDTIRKTAAELIDAIDSKFQEIVKERNISFAIAEQQDEITAPEISVVDILNNNVIDGVINNEPLEIEEIPPNNRALISNIQGYIQSYGRIMDITDNEIYKTVLRWREEEKSGDYRDVAEYMLTERTQLDFRQNAVQEQLSALSQAETLDAKYDIAFKVLVGALCENEELLALASTGEGWQKGTGRAAIYDGGYYDTLIGNYETELADLLADSSMTNRLRNTVLGETYRRLDSVAYNRYILDDYADVIKSGRLDIYETPYPEDSVNTGILVHLTEELPDGSKHDYGYIFGYDPNDKRDYAINDYLSFKSFSLLRESFFGKTESTIKLSYKETEPVGSMVLRRLLFNDGMLNRELKRTRVEILPPMGKYSLYAQHLNGVIGDNTLVHVGTDSGYLVSLGVSRTRFDERFVEAQIDSIFEKAPKLLDDALTDPAKFARFDWAAITGRIEEAEKHNVIYKSIQSEKDQERREEIAANKAAADKEAKSKYVEQIKINADIIENGGNFKIEKTAYTGKNNLLELFALYDIEVPLATKGWFNNKLVSFEKSANGYSYSSYNNKGRRASEMGETAYKKLAELRAMIKAIPIADKLAQKGLLADEKHEQTDKQNNESMKVGEDMQYSELQETPSFTPDDKDFWRGEIASFLAANDGKMELNDLELPPIGNHGGLGKFFQVFGEYTHKRDFADIVAQENTKRTGEPWVVFSFCEGGEYRPEFFRTPSAMLFAEADKFIRGYESKVRELLDGGYDKLDITVYIKREDNEVYQINDRYDIGDSKKVSGLYNVFKAEADYFYSHPEIYDWDNTAENFAKNKERTYADIAILKNAVTTEYPYVEIEKVIRYADGDKLDQRVFNKGEILPFAEADSKIKTEEKAIREKNMKKYGNPGDGDEELGIAVHFKMPGENEASVFRVSYRLGDYDEERGGLLKHFEMGAFYYNLCIKEGDYSNVNAMLGGKTPDDAMRLASDYTKMYEILRGGMAEPEQKIIEEQTTVADLMLPDNSIGVSEMNLYGYSYEKMLPLTTEKAVELFNSDHCVYLLYPDNTEAMALDRDEIMNHDGICGIESVDWERSPIRAAQLAVAVNSEGSRESDLLFGSENKFGIYQIRDGINEARNFRFTSKRELDALGLSVDRANYELVYVGNLDIRDTLINLHKIFNEFQGEHPNCPSDFQSRSVSVSDIVVLQWRGNISSHYVDSVGFVKLDAFLGNEKQNMPIAETPAQENKTDTLYQVGTRSDEYKGASTAELEADVKNGKIISLTDLSKAINAENKNKNEQKIFVDGVPPSDKPKGKPSTLMERLNEGKQKAAQNGQSDASKNNKREDLS